MTPETFGHRQINRVQPILCHLVATFNMDVRRFSAFLAEKTKRPECIGFSIRSAPFVEEENNAAAQSISASTDDLCSLSQRLAQTVRVPRCLSCVDSGGTWFRP